jgi:hypothetical protein
MVEGHNAQELFNTVFGKTVQVLVKYTDTYVQDSYDSIAIFLCIHLVQRYQLLCHKRCVPGKGFSTVPIEISTLKHSIN